MLLCLSTEKQLLLRLAAKQIETFSSQIYGLVETLRVKATRFEK